MRIRAIEPHDLPLVLALNAAEVPRVGPLDEPGLRDLVGLSERSLIAVDGEQPLGFVITVAPGTRYASVNYRFFEDRGGDHLYVDRVAVAPDGRRRGVASALYDAVEAHATATARAEVTCEVNLDPPNEGSLAFHRARGFGEVGQQVVGDLRVSLLAKPIGRAIEVPGRWSWPSHGRPRPARNG